MTEPSDCQWISGYRHMAPTTYFLPIFGPIIFSGRTF